MGSPGFLEPRHCLGHSFVIRLQKKPVSKKIRAAVSYLGALRLEPISVTGLGITTCLGAGAEDNWAGIRSGSSGLRPITRLELAGYPVRMGGEAPRRGQEPGPEGALGPELRELEGVCLEALSGAGLEDGVFPDPERAALVVGSSLAGSSTGEKFFKEYVSRGPQRTDFGLLDGYYLEGALGLLCRRFHIAGPSLLISNACAAGASSIARGAGLLRSGRADWVLAAGYDPLSIFTFAGFGSLLALSRTLTRPFSRNRDGMLLGDGYAALVLERCSDARAAGRRPLGLLLGCGESTDAHHLTHPHPEGGGAAKAMRSALEMARLSPGEIDHINCHGTATRPNDLSEYRAMAAVFGERLRRIPLSSSKPFFGHTLGGAGAVEAVVTLLAIHHQYLPPTLNLDEAEPEFGELDLVPAGRAAEIRHAMSNSFGFGGSNASLVFGRAEAR
jgi:3-oxoacyl-[acyl-carrier-protein] synthase II